MLKYAALVSIVGLLFASIPEWSKGTDLRSVASASWVRIPLDASKKFTNSNSKTNKLIIILKSKLNQPGFPSGQRGQT